tara:strand:- start:1346 stop:1810 length:465 start_codon:yes stop_codon:yes gene_type:complete
MNIAESKLPTSDIKVTTRSNNLFYWLIAVSFFSIGVYLTKIGYLNTEWFTRSGCVVVMLGIWSSLGAIIHEHLVIRRSGWKRNQALKKSRFRLLKEKSHTQIGESEFNEINDTHDKELTNAIHHLRLSIGVLEVSLLVSGTFVWGFGDLLMLFI